MKIPNPSGDLDDDAYTLGEPVVDINLDDPATGWDEFDCAIRGYRKLVNNKTGAIRIIPQGRTLGCPSTWDLLLNATRP